MAMMINCATDWTYDLFMEDASLYNAKPIKGVHCASDASDRERFMTWLKDLARDFEAEWRKEHNNHLFDGCQWAGEVFAQLLREACFSDYYKDTYGQRPHLPMWFYVQAVKLPHGEDVSRTFCASPVKDATRRARKVRECEW
jgi:hypothetical protein